MGEEGEMARKTVHVVPQKSGWAVKTGGASRAGSTHKTKATAEKTARARSKRMHAELVLHGRNGRIQHADSHGRDTFPPRG
jgi:hypothetical protein